ncbi:MAG: hypothetical protein BWX88_03002 [Planctomycetes bacterium ADurb.Bin126]|nr:MAG: hypothetical protein BWX88_03002 [Planctomycetes bacterium ADurb.Bin126]HOD81567.1 LPS assembly lipoprotein LptE [Phycisphaerae bacterium]HQL71881.1 LPS assembly lipoprotein LptE [Phycisphaerae bacterium]
MRHRLSLAVVLAAVLVHVGGCSSDPHAGYTFQSPYPSTVKTVAVPMWNRGALVYTRNLEMRLTEAIVKHIELLTPYKVTEPARADTRLNGTIDQVQQQVTSFNTDTGRPREKMITITVSFVWQDLRSGKELVRRKRFRETGTFLPSAPLDQDQFQGYEDTINRLARRIVEELEAEW